MPGLPDSEDVGVFIIGGRPSALRRAYRYRNDDHKKKKKSVAPGGASSNEVVWCCLPATISTSLELRPLPRRVCHLAATRGGQASVGEGDSVV